MPRRFLAACTALLALAAAQAHAQYTNTLNGRQFSNLHAANADFLMSQMIRQGQWNIMRLSLEQQMRRQQAGARAPAPAPAAPAKASFKYPLAASDFLPAGPRRVPEQLSQAVTDAKERRQFEQACRDILRTVEATAGFRRHNLASAMTLLLGVSLQVARGIEIPDAETDGLMRGLNDQLAGLPAFLSLPADRRTQVYDTMVIVGGLIAGIAQNAAETRNAEMAALARQMARDSLAQFGVKS